MLKSELLPSAAELVLPEDATDFEQGVKTRRVCEALGLGLDPWQAGAVRAIEARRPDGKYAARTVAMSIGRQVGKTYLIGALVLARCLMQKGLTAVWTAHRFSVARETFGALHHIAETPLVAKHVSQITTAAGNEVIRFTNGSRLVFKSRERAAIRGFSKVGLLVLDEAQILTDAALGDMLPTTNQYPDPQVIMLGTPPRPNDPGEAFTRSRDRALKGDSKGLTFIQFSGEAIEDANPSYPHRTSPEAIEAMRTALSEADFRREALGIWDSSQGNSLIPADVWSELADMSPPVMRRRAFAVDVSPDRSFATIARAGMYPDGVTVHVEVKQNRSLASGSSWIADWLVENADRCPVVVDTHSPAASVLSDLHSARLRVVTTHAPEMSQACGGLVDAVANRLVRHFDQPGLNLALDAARTRPIGVEGGWGWARRGTDRDITPLVAVTLARYGLVTATRPEGKKGSVLVL